MIPSTGSSAADPTPRRPPIERLPRDVVGHLLTFMGPGEFAGLAKTSTDNRNLLSLAAPEALEAALAFAQASERHENADAAIGQLDREQRDMRALHGRALTDYAGAQAALDKARDKMKDVPFFQRRGFIAQFQTARDRASESLDAVTTLMISRHKRTELARYRAKAFDAMCESGIRFKALRDAAAQRAGDALERGAWGPEKPDVG